MVLIEINMEIYKRKTPTTSTRVSVLQEYVRISC